jgi:hypothetical protein
MMAIFAQTHSLPREDNDLLLITQPALRAQLLKARLINEMSATCVIQRGEHVYLSLRNVTDKTERKELAWAVSRLQMGAIIHPQEVPDPLRTVLLAAAAGPSPLLKSLLGGMLAGVMGGVLVMALVGLVLIILNVSAESYVGFFATAVAFLFSATIIGCSMSVYFWRKFKC